MKAITSLLVFFTIISGKVNPTDTSIEGTWLFCMTKIKGVEILTNSCPSIALNKGNGTIFLSEKKVTASFIYRLEGSKLIVSKTTPKCMISDGEYAISRETDNQFRLLSEDKTEYTLGRTQ